MWLRFCVVVNDRRSSVPFVNERRVVKKGLAEIHLLSGVYIRSLQFTAL